MPARRMIGTDPREFADAVAAERARQIEKGYTLDHDKEHGIHHLLALSAEYSRRNEPVKAAAMISAAWDLLPQIITVITPDEIAATIAAKVRANCTPPSEAHDRGGDFLISAVADWIENPPEWVDAPWRKKA
jgi:hypothetical protein